MGFGFSGLIDYARGDYKPRGGRAFFFLTFLFNIFFFLNENVFFLFLENGFKRFMFLSLFIL